MHHVLLDVAVLPACREVGETALPQAAGAGGVIHGAPVVRVDQAEVPVFGALVDVGHAWGGQVQHGLD